jgi:hypothetical protein
VPVCVADVREYGVECVVVVVVVVVVLSREGLRLTCIQ